MPLKQIYIVAGQDGRAIEQGAYCTQNAGLHDDVVAGYPADDAKKSASTSDSGVSRKQTGSHNDGVPAQGVVAAGLYVDAMPVCKQAVGSQVADAIVLDQSGVHFSAVYPVDMPGCQSRIRRDDAADEVVDDVDIAFGVDAVEAVDVSSSGIASVDDFISAYHGAVATNPDGGLGVVIEAIVFDAIKPIGEAYPGLEAADAATPDGDIQAAVGEDAGCLCLQSCGEVSELEFVAIYCDVVGGHGDRGPACQIGRKVAPEAINSLRADCRR